MKKVLQTLVLLIGTAVSGLMLSLTGAAAQFTITFSVDEDGHGTATNSTGFFSALPFSLANDPTPGGLANAATYGLLNPPGLVAGNLILLEPGTGNFSDLIRFNPTENGGSLVFYSDTTDGVDSKADIGFPTGFNIDSAFVEVGPEGNNGFTYTPIAGEPGFIAGARGPVTYVLISDSPSAVPLPSTWLMLLGGLAGLGFFGYFGTKKGSAAAIAAA